MSSPDSPRMLLGPLQTGHATDVSWRMDHEPAGHGEQSGEHCSLSLFIVFTFYRGVCSWIWEVCPGTMAPVVGLELLMLLREMIGTQLSLGLLFLILGLGREGSGRSRMADTSNWELLVDIYWILSLVVAECGVEAASHYVCDLNSQYNKDEH